MRISKRAKSDQYVTLYREARRMIRAWDRNVDVDDEAVDRLRDKFHAAVDRRC